MGTILAGVAMLALAGCGGGTAANNVSAAPANDIYLPPDDLGGNDLLLNESDLNALPPAADNGAAGNSAGNGL